MNRQGAVVRIRDAGRVLHGRHEVVVQRDCLDCGGELYERCVVVVVVGEVVDEDVLVDGDDASGVGRGIVDEVRVANQLATVTMYPSGFLSRASTGTDGERECPREGSRQRGGLHVISTLMTGAFRTSPCSATYLVCTVAQVSPPFLILVKIGRNAENGMEAMTTKAAENTLLAPIHPVGVTMKGGGPVIDVQVGKPVGRPVLEIIREGVEVSLSCRAVRFRLVGRWRWRTG